MAQLDPDALQEINRLAVTARIVSASSHDLNNALQVISGSAELLALKQQIGPAEQRRIGSIGTQTARAAAVLSRLTAYTRPDTGRQPQDLAALVDVALELREFALNRAHVATQVDRREPPPCRSVVNRSQILQVLLNVLLNSEAALKDRPDGTIVITVARNGAEWTVTLADNGPGLSDRDRQRAEDAGAPPLGPAVTGIGLWVSRRIAQEHGGRLDITSSSSGTSIALALPAA